jgi:uncharacterized RDD family membrane protein YckC
MSATISAKPVLSVAGFAGVVSRTIAYVADCLIVAIASTGAAAGIYLVASVVGSDARDLARTLTTTYLVGLPVVFALYCTGFWGLTGRTPGMAVVGVRVVGSSRDRVRWWSALVRAVLLAYFPIGSLWLLVDRRHRAIHDLVARTVVIRR